MKDLELTERVDRRKIENLIHASFLVGFMAAAEKRTIEHPDNREEIKKLKSLISQTP